MFLYSAKGRVTGGIKKVSPLILLYTVIPDADKGWTKQLHLWPIRNNRSTYSNNTDAGGDP